MGPEDADRPQRSPMVIYFYYSAGVGVPLAFERTGMRLCARKKIPHSGNGVAQSPKPSCGMYKYLKLRLCAMQSGLP